MKVKVEYSSNGNREGKIIDISSVPRVGEQLVMDAAEVFEVVKVAHTPGNKHHDAVVWVKKIEG